MRAAGLSQALGATPPSFEAWISLAYHQFFTLGALFSPKDIVAFRKRARFGDSRFLHALYDEMRGVATRAKP